MFWVEKQLKGRNYYNYIKKNFIYKSQKFQDPSPKLTYNHMNNSMQKS